MTASNLPSVTAENNTPVVGKSPTKATANVKIMARAFSVASNAISCRPIVPVLGCCRLIIADGVARFTATDMDISVSLDIPVASENSSSFLIDDPKDVAKWLRMSGGDAATITAIDDKVKIDVGTLSWEQNDTICADDFPQPFIPGDAVWGATLGRDFINTLKRVRIACSTEQTRYYLNGVFIHDADGQIKAVATDGRRLHIGQIVAPDAVGSLPPSGIIIPTAALNVLFALSDADKGAPILVKIRPMMLKKAVGDLAVPSQSVPLVEFSIGGVTLATKTIDGTYPDYAKAVPGAALHRAAFSAADLAHAIECVTIGTKKKGRPAVSIGFGPDNARIKCEWNYRIGSRTALVSVAHDIPDGMSTLGINGRYLLEGIRAIGAETSVSLGFVDVPRTGSHCTPISLHSADDDTFRVVIMPMRV